MPTKAIDLEAQLIEDIAAFTHDPLGFVLYAWRWGEPGPLEKEYPRQWQIEVLNYIKTRLREGASIPSAVADAIKIARASGHGIGKSALISWIIIWAISTCENTRGVVTANTENQLRTKTWPEVGKWHNTAINKHWFTFAATSLHANGAAEKTWRIDAIPWSDTNTEAFAGLHNKGSRILVIFDEGSAISNKIWEVAEGALTDEGTEIIWLAFGNPTRNSGAFRDCFGRMAHRWNNKQIDSRTVPGTNKKQLQEWVDDYGEDSDFVRVRVRGMFPMAGTMQLIGSDVVTAATKAPSTATIHDAMVMGVDVARAGDDETVIWLRRGNDARTIAPVVYRGQDTMMTVGRAAELANKHHVQTIFVDETGIGAGVVDRLRQLGFNVIGVNNGSRPDAPRVGSDATGNKASEMWVAMRDWLVEGGCIPADNELTQQLEGREYGYDAKNHIIVERKDDMKKRGLSSPDRADALALTLAYPVVSRDSVRGGSSSVGVPGMVATAVTEYDPYA